MTRLISMQFTQEEKNGMIMALNHHLENLAVSELIATLQTPGETVMMVAEALALGDLIREYYFFISDRIDKHPGILGTTDK